MSQMERNKGRLIPTGIDTTLFSDVNYETYEEEGFIVLDEEIYEVEWEAKAKEDMGFVDFKITPKGVIDFHTCHYNGGGYWTEVIEDVLKRVPDEIKDKKEKGETLNYKSDKGFS